jgi:hypothetical protein
MRLGDQVHVAPQTRLDQRNLQGFLERPQRRQSIGSAHKDRPSRAADTIENDGEGLRPDRSRDRPCGRNEARRHLIRERSQTKQRDVQAIRINRSARRGLVVVQLRHQARQAVSSTGIRLDREEQPNCWREIELPAERRLFRRVNRHLFAPLLRHQPPGAIS